MNKTQRALLEMDSVALMVLLFTVVVSVVGLWLIGVPKWLIDDVFLVVWLGASVYTFMRVRKTMAEFGKRQPPGSAVVLFIMGAYVGWCLWVWPKAVKKLAKVL
jgi:Na+/citrate or Na+/malate symporter